jgi:sterol desaturase/sphingolipid hydroxylase (fatty acid hydroxylase superfamily)
MLEILINILCQIIIGYFAADLLSGLLHWIEDKYTNFCTDHTYLSTLSKNNELHHTNPEAILVGNFYDNMRNALIASSIVFGISYLLFGEIMKENIWGFSVFFILITLANNIHRYAHEFKKNIPKPIKFLQDLGILSSISQHKIHHDKGESRYCLIGDYSNYVIDYFNLWNKLEKIPSYFGIEPNTAKPLLVENHPYKGRKYTNMYIKTKSDYIKGLEILSKVHNCKKSNNE